MISNYTFTHIREREKTEYRNKIVWLSDIEEENKQETKKKREKENKIQRTKLKMSDFKEVYDENAIIAQLLVSLEEKDYKIALLKSEVTNV